MNTNGASVIDYVLCSQHVINLISNFSIDISISSHHMPIVIELKRTTKNETNEQNRYWLKKPGNIIKKFKWFEDRKETFFERLSDDKSIDIFTKMYTHLVANDWEGGAVTFANLLYYAGSEMEVKNKSHPINPSTRGKAWYNETCREAKNSTVIALRAYRRVGDDETRKFYIQLRNEYKKILSNAKSYWQTEWVNKIKIVLGKGDQVQVWR